MEWSGVNPPHSVPRDPNGFLLRNPTFTAHEPKEASLPRLHDHHQIFDASAPMLDKNPTKISSREDPSPRRRRSLPQVPGSKTGSPGTSTPNSLEEATGSTSMIVDDRQTSSPLRPSSEYNVGVRSLVPLEKYQPCPWYCTEETPVAYKTCLHADCGVQYCGGCLYSGEGPMFLRVDGVTYDKCASCGRNPSAIPIAERPLWVGERLDSLAGAPIQPNILDQEGYYKFTQSEEVFIMSLRTDDDATSWRRPPSREAQYAKGDSMPDVFSRLTDVNRYPRRHRNKFDADGKGLGLEGSKDDNEWQLNMTGNAMITRNIDPSFDCPNKPFCAFEVEKINQSMLSTTSAPRKAGDYPPLKNSTFYGRMAQPHPRHVADAPPTEYDTMQAVDKTLNARGRSVLKFQTEC